jgi:hypothetical protein
MIAAIIISMITAEAAPMPEQLLAVMLQRIALVFVEVHTGQRARPQQCQRGGAVAVAHGMRQRCQIERVGLPVAPLQRHAPAGEPAWRCQRLQGIGDHDADFACCAAVDSLAIVPSQGEPGVLRATRA